MKDLIIVIALLIIPATCTVLVEQEQTKRDEICKEFLLKCEEIKKECQC